MEIRGLISWNRGLTLWNYGLTPYLQRQTRFASHEKPSGCPLLMVGAVNILDATRGSTIVRSTFEQCAAGIFGGSLGACP